MKILYPLLATSIFLVNFRVAAQGTIIYQNNFSGTLNPGSVRTTLGDATFHNIWSVTTSLQSESGNQYARFDINTPSLSTNSNARWYGGYFSDLGSMTALPTQWQLSFDVFLTAAEPFQVSFEFNPGWGQPPLFPTSGTVTTYSVTPADIGWQRVAIDQNTSFSARQRMSRARAGTYLTMCLASHDPDGNALTISQIGPHYFFLDNVTLQSVPEPSVLAFFAMTGALFVGMRRNRTICSSGRADCTGSCSFGEARH